MIHLMNKRIHTMVVTAARPKEETIIEILILFSNRRTQKEVAVHQVIYQMAPKEIYKFGVLYERRWKILFSSRRRAIDKVRITRTELLFRALKCERNLLMTITRRS